LIEVLASPGAKAQVAAAAPTQKVTAGDETDVDTVAALGPDDVEKAIAVAEVEKDVAFHTEAKHRRLDRWLDAVVKASGSQLVFFVVLAGLLAWMFLDQVLRRYQLAGRHLIGGRPEPVAKVGDHGGGYRRSVR